MKDWYTAADAPELVEFGPVRGLGVTGMGEPGGAEHSAAIQSLYAVAGPILRGTFPPLEGRWWVEDDRPPLTVPRSEWRWHLFLRLDDSVEAKRVDTARGAAPMSSGARVQLVTFTEGKCVQTMHRGPYDEEPKTLAQMDNFMTANGFVRNGLHHEIYLSDFAETDPAKMRTILRQPVRSF